LSAKDLHEKSWPIVQPALHASRRSALARYDELGGTPRVTQDLSEVLSAAFDGRVDSLFAKSGAHLWGTFDGVDRKITRHDDPQPGDEDLINLAALSTIQNSGQVYVLSPEEMPQSQVLAALLRY
jgi:hypothetical protein